MKGLVLNAMGRKEEADEAVKRSIKADMLSSLCWHVYGIISRSNRNFEQALRCYRRALKSDPVRDQRSLDGGGSGWEEARGGRRP